jgi:hypothetical protein
MSIEAEMLEYREQVEDALLRDDPFELMDVISRVALEAEPWDFAQACCVQLARHRNAMVRGNAVNGFGQLARRFGRLDPNVVKRLVDRALQDRNEYVREQALSAADDLATFLAWDFERPQS